MSFLRRLASAAIVFAGAPTAIIVAGALINFGGAVAPIATAQVAPDPSNPFGLQPVKPDLVAAGILNPALSEAEARKWLIVLGKALFWDIQVGSDGNACASCHFSAGTDSRVTNSLNPNFTNVSAAWDRPGLNKDGVEVASPGDGRFGSDKSYLGTGLAANDPTLGTPLQADGQIGDPGLGTLRPSGPNITLQNGDLPFHKLVQKFVREGQIEISTNDRVSSAGSVSRAFGEVLEARFRDRCKKDPDSIFHTSKGKLARQVEPRNTPTTVNSAFFPVQFWDGRAKNVFNGFNPFGRSGNVHAPVAGMMVLDAATGYVKQDLELVAILNGSLASQATGPPLSEVEMSCLGREFQDLGRKMLSEARLPLKRQKIDAKDSVFGKTGITGIDLVRASGKGLKEAYDYPALIKRVFAPKWWAAKGYYKYATEAGGAAKAVWTSAKSEDAFTQMESNFSLFWGLAIQAYEETLISADNRFFRAQVACGFHDDVNLVIGSAPPGGQTTTAADQAALNGCVVATKALAEANNRLTQQEAHGFQLFNNGFGGGPPGPGCKC
jgi:cytochrome c peroxidase